MISNSLVYRRLPSFVCCDGKTKYHDFHEDYFTIIEERISKSWMRLSSKL